MNNNGLQYYEQDYINPIAQILTEYQHTNIRVIAVIEPDSRPNLVTNLNDERPFRGDWCNQNNAGLGAFPQANPNSSVSHLYAYVWIKPG